jgi:hypothetical protein
MAGRWVQAGGLQVRRLATFAEVLLGVPNRPMSANSAKSLTLNSVPSHLVHSPISHSSCRRKYKN